MVEAVDILPPEKGINRNILECKSSLERSKSVIYAVLIETYWNVNSSASSC